MKTTTILSGFAAAALVASLASFASLGCAAHATSHPVTAASFGDSSSGAALEAIVDEPGPIEVETILSAEWEIDRSGLLDLESPKAKAAGLKDGPEPIALFLHVIHHPTKGMYLVDSGVEHAFTASPSDALIHGLVASFAHFDKMTVRRDTSQVLAAAHEPVAGVFLTHLHLDHVFGLRDVPSSTPIFVGAGDAEEKSFMNVFQKGIYDTALEGKGPLREVRFARDPSGAFDGVADVFGDGSLFAIWVPGHTPGSIAFVARTPRGSVLLTGDACHTAWGWNHDVGPGTFSVDVKKSAESLDRLERFVARHPSIDVRPGHQELHPPRRQSPQP